MKGIAAIACAGVAAACTVGPNFKPPLVEQPIVLHQRTDTVASRTVETAIDESWWTSFGDPELTSLVNRLVRQNFDLASAAERVAQARAQRAVIAAQGLPHINANASYMHQRVSKNGLVSLYEPSPGAPLEFNQWDDSLAASWELDLFGRVRRAVEAADANTQATVEARRSILLAGIADVAQTYMQLRGVQARAAVTLHDIEIAKTRGKLVRDRQANDVATLLDVAQADAQASTIAEELPPLRASESKLMNILSLLLAEPPHSLDQELARTAGQPLVPPTVPIGLPGELVLRRPDVREAQALLHSATAQTGVAVAAFYPDVTLTGSLGSESLHPSSLFDWASRMFSIGPKFDLPMFEGGQLRGTLHLREAAQREAAIAYQKTVLQAWHDVDNALTAYAEGQHRYAAVTEAERNDETALRFAEQRYREGVVDFLDVTSAQAQLVGAQNAQAQAQTDLETNLVDLYKALGGGWRDEQASLTSR